MEVKVRDIHVRYEDSTPVRRGTLAAGVTLHSLELKVRMRGKEGAREGGSEGGREGARERGREGENVTVLT